MLKKILTACKRPNRWSEYTTNIQRIPDSAMSHHFLCNSCHLRDNFCFPPKICNFDFLTGLELHCFFPTLERLALQKINYTCDSTEIYKVLLNRSQHKLGQCSAVICFKYKHLITDLLLSLISD